MIDVGRDKARREALWGPLPVGFGCSTLLDQGRGRKDAARLVEAALDAGVVYFDTARMYGDGEAEGILGEVLGRDRERLRIATKLGVLPPSRSLLTRAAAKGTRSLLRAVPGAERFVSEPASARPRFHAFDRQSMLQSFEASLAALGVDYVDVLLLHECREEDLRDGAVAEVLQMLRGQGRARAFGLATSVRQSLRIQKVAPQLCDIIQVAAFNRAAFVSDVVTHSVFSGPMERLRAALLAEPQLREVLGVDPSDAAGLARLLLSRALQRNPQGMVLFSSSRPSAIGENVALARRAPRLSAATGALIDRLVGLHEESALEIA